MNDNNFIESLFENVGVICIDDIVELFSKYDSKEAFEAVNSKLWAFLFSPNEELASKFEKTEKTV